MTPDPYAIDALNNHRDKQLWAAVILQALEDATSAVSMATPLDRRSARNWFIRGGKDFREVCSLAEMDHEAIRKAALQKIEEVDAQAALDGEANRARRRRFDYNGERLTLKELSIRTGLSASSLHHRVKQGLTGEALVAPSSKTPRTLTHNGKTRTIAEWAEISGVSDAVIRRRLDQGLSAEEALSKDYKRPKTTGSHRWNDHIARMHAARRASAKRYTVDGRSLTLREWAEQSGLKLSTLQGRITDGWTIERALTTTVKKKTKRPQKEAA
jgi:lambda repressor-like predicted transcriptional regulator